MAITCKDRNKLLFDTVCTLADMDYEVFHATIDSRAGVAMQEYWIKARNGNAGALRQHAHACGPVAVCKCVCTTCFPASWASLLGCRAGVRPGLARGQVLPLSKGSNGSTAPIPDCIRCCLI